MIVVFLNNKLVSCDTITPLIYEAFKRSPRQRIEFHCFDRRTFNAIRNSPTLYAAICEMGKLIMFTDHRRNTRREYLTVRAWRRMIALIRLVRLASIAIFAKPVFIHFKALNEWPLRLLYVLNSKRTYIFEPSTAGHSELERITDRLIQARENIDVKIAASTLICFTNHWALLSAPEASSKKKIRIGKPFTRPVWTEFLQAQFDRFRLTSGLSATRPVIVFILTSMDNQNIVDPTTNFLELFRETLDILVAERPDALILVKRHPVTLKDFILAQDKIIQKYPPHNVMLTDLHPAVLAPKAEFFIANCYSTTFMIAVTNSIPTIEYTLYTPSIRDATGGGSTRPDLVSRFIAREPELLREAIRKPSSARKAAHSYCAVPDPAYDDVISLLIVK